MKNSVIFSFLLLVIAPAAQAMEYGSFKDFNKAIWSYVQNRSPEALADLISRYDRLAPTETNTAKRDIINILGTTIGDLRGLAKASQQPVTTPEVVITRISVQPTGEKELQKALALSQQEALEEEELRQAKALSKSIQDEQERRRKEQQEVSEQFAARLAAGEQEIEEAVVRSEIEEKMLQKALEDSLKDEEKRRKDEQEAADEALARQLAGEVTRELIEPEEPGKVIDIRIIPADADLSGEKEEPETKPAEVAIDNFKKVMDAIEAKSERYLRNLLTQHTINLNQQDELGRTPLVFAIKQELSPRIIDLLIHKGADVNLVDFNKMSPLIAAAAADKDLETVAAILLDSGADINYYEPTEKYTALMVAASEGNIAIVKLLLDRGADKDIVSSRGEKAEKLATLPEIADLLR